jgi:hypothetical protein
MSLLDLAGQSGLLASMASCAAALIAARRGERAAP